MPLKINKEKKVSKKDQDAIISRHNRRVQIDLRRAMLPNTILFFLKKRPHYSLEIREKIMQYAAAMASFAQENLNQMAPFNERDLKIQQNIIYNNLMKLEKKGILGSYREKSSKGADRKYYYLTEFGNRFYDEVIAKRLYPRIFMLYCFMDAGIESNGLKCGFSKKELAEFKKLFSQLVE